MGRYDDLLERAKWEPDTVTAEEIAAVAALLHTAPEEDRYTLLYILGCVGNPTEHRSLVERYLAGPDDLLAQLAVYILCRWWDLAPQYVDELFAFVQGVDWDDLEQVRWVAVSVAGEYLQDHQEPDLLEILLDIYRNVDIKHSTREYAYWALAEAVGADYETSIDPIPLDPPPDPTIITRALKRLVDERIAIVNARRSP
jgi:hypothetical protein